MAIDTRVSKELLKDQNDLTAIAENSFKMEKSRLLKRKSIRIFNPKIQFYHQHEDNFIRNLVTCIITFDGYKVPRIVKKQLRA